MYTLYYAPGSANLVVHLALIETGARYELKKIDIENGEQRTPAYLAINPLGVVPTLIVDGVAHTEAASLAMLLAERHPDARLAPAVGSAQRADYLQWMFYLANNLQSLFRQWFYPGDHLAEGAEAVKEHSRIGIEKGWTFLDRHLAEHGPYLLGDTFTLPDLYALMLMRWARHMPRPATEWPHIAALATRLKARPAWQRMCEEEALVEWA
ncbi:MAG: glutathione S-transferase family protein [Rhodanobacter sp.]|nr:MAG: glutathione S-transferase family protein [Rhodanobacter sp.]TAM15187.1 MAG: glutathione S-transferase family protein [Rhodanobacter sp.]TAM36663.1 MAG: glutathione S-transferase family protein [Rhodanobacter sp.]